VVTPRGTIPVPLRSAGVCFPPAKGSWAGGRQPVRSEHPSAAPSLLSGSDAGRAGGWVWTGQGGWGGFRHPRELQTLLRDEEGAKQWSAGTVSLGACIPNTRAPAYFLLDHNGAAKHFLLPGYLLLNI